MKQTFVKQRIQEHRRSVASQLDKSRSNDTAFVDNRDSAIAQRRCGDSMQQSPKVTNQRDVISRLDNSPNVVMQRKQLAEVSGKAVQRQEDREEEELLQGRFETVQQQEDLEDDELLQGKFETAQRQKDLEGEELLQGKFEATQRESIEEEEEPVQGKFVAGQSPLQLQEETSKAENRTDLPALGKPEEMYESKPLEGMDPLTYEEAMATFKRWKRPRMLGGLSKSQRVTEAVKYLAEVVGLGEKYTSHVPMIVNSVLEAYKNTFGQELSTIDEMKSLQQAGSNISPEPAGKSVEEFDKAKEKERKLGIIEETEKAIGTGFSLGEKGSSTTRSLIDILTPKDKDGKSFSKSKKGEQPMGIAEGATDIFSALGSGISGIFGIVKTARLIKEKQGSKAFVSLLDTASDVAEAVIKGAQGVFGVVGSAINAGSGSVLDIAKKVLGPIPDAIKTVIGVVKIAYAAARKKTKESLEAGWETVKSGIDTITSTISTVFDLISTLGDAVPVVGSIAKGISAILNGIEAGYMFVKRIRKFLSMEKLIVRITEKIKELRSRPAETEAKKADKTGRRKRLVYIAKNNLKKIKNIGRQVAKQATALVGNGVKLIGAVFSLIGEIVSLSGVGAPLGVLFKAFGAISSIFSSIIGGIAAAITNVPKLFHSIRQLGRNLAAKEGGIGKFFSALGFSAEKSSAKKEEKRKKVVIGIFDDAARLKTDFDDPAGKDREKVNAEIPKYKNLEFEIEATGADKNELYKHNAEENDEKRARAQVKVIYDALTER